MLRNFFYDSLPFYRSILLHEQLPIFQKHHRLHEWLQQMKIVITFDICDKIDKIKSLPPAFPSPAGPPDIVRTLE